ncbi:hypothetical protein BDV33DRAFT_167401 [Aspergillus novoparasiticus]|uniref:Uncharacterized protein n=1 Tax=Aspergillus novoparasiticus TaxID=986946 RepID=A0A5N6F2B1_9EURO|nr:hypothetical protein BDV33DRAFT_167401 [Aspergillus novoparasiticus]
MSQYRLVRNHRVVCFGDAKKTLPWVGVIVAGRTLKVTINELRFRCLLPPQVGILVISILGLKQQPSVQGQWLKWAVLPLSLG